LKQSGNLRIIMFQENVPQMRTVTISIVTSNRQLALWRLVSFFPYWAHSKSCHRDCNGNYGQKRGFPFKNPDLVFVILSTLVVIIMKINHLQAQWPENKHHLLSFWLCGWWHLFVSQTPWMISACLSDESQWFELLTAGRRSMLATFPCLAVGKLFVGFRKANRPQLTHHSSEWPQLFQKVAKVSQK
jgi:hypothetical protein